MPTQLAACTRRAYQRLWNDKASTITMVASKVIMGLIIGSIYYGTPTTTDGLFARGSVLFFSILFNALNAIVEINTLYSQRPIIEKHASYAFYHPFAEALGSLFLDLPIKIVSVTCFCIILYFLANLRREPSQFFIFLIFNLLAAITMSCIARTIGAATRTISKALAMAGVVVLGVVIYTGRFINLQAESKLKTLQVLQFHDHICILGSRGSVGLILSHTPSKAYSSMNCMAENFLARLHRWFLHIQT